MTFDGSYTIPWDDGEERVSKFVFIGKNLDRDELASKFVSCKAGDLRFAVGDVVEVRYNLPIDYDMCSALNHLVS